MKRRKYLICLMKSSLTFFRDKNGFEVDTIADWKHTFAIEVKSNSEAEKKMSSNVKKYAALKGSDTQGMVYYLGTLTCDINGVQYVAWEDWGK